MQLIKFITSIIYLCLLPYIYVSAQAENKNNDTKLWENKIYKKGIETVLIYKTGWELSFPIIDLNNDEEKITLLFDELGSDINDYSWQIIHCNMDWTQSELDPIDYVSGFSEGSINDYQTSRNTTVDYINYQVNFPNDDLRFQKSGNYIVKIFEQNDAEQIVLSKRFYVVDKKARISGDIFQQSVASIGKNQRVNFTINFDNEIINPYSNLVSMVLKNSTSGISTKNISPSMLSNNQVSYKNINALAFPGGNEFRHFDIKSIKFLSDMLERINYTDNIYKVYLRPSIILKDAPYHFKNDINGKRLIKLENNDNSNIEADYCEVKFRLDAPLNLQNGSYYVFGALSDWNTSDNFKMYFNETCQCYTLSVFLKQGYYNYQYVFKNEGLSIDETAQWFSVEGSYHQTENDYYILTYYKNPSEYSEELISFAKINSAQANNHH